jgi:hypothetical protein
VYGRYVSSLVTGTLRRCQLSSLLLLERQAPSRRKTVVAATGAEAVLGAPLPQRVDGWQSKGAVPK